MAFDPVTGWVTGHTVNAGEAPHDDNTAASGSFSTKDAQSLQKIIQELVDAMDFIASN
jgi:hypothetical protein